MSAEPLAVWMSPLLRTAWSFRAESTPPAPAGAGQAPAASQPQAGTNTPPQAGGDDGQGASLSPAELAAELARARREAAGYRSRLTTLEKQQQDADAAKLSDLEKAQAETATLKAQLAQRDHADLQREVAAEAGLPAQMASRLQGATREELIADAKALAKLIPAQGAPAAPQANPANPARANGGPPLTISDLKGKSPDWINANWPRVQEVMRKS